MLQTSSSSPAAGILSLDTSPRPGAERVTVNGDDFSQEFDKQVKNIDSSEQNRDSSKAKGSTKDASGTDPLKTGSKPESKQDAEGGMDEAATESEESGNILPLEQMRKVAAEVELELEAELASDGSVLADEADATMDELAAQAAIINLPVEETARAAIGQAAVVPVAEPEVEVEELELVDDMELSDSPFKSRAKEGDLTAMLGRQSNQANDGRGGDRGFESLLTMQGQTGSHSVSGEAFSPLLAPLTGMAGTSPLATPLPVSMTLAVPMQQPNWGGAVAERVVWMTNANIQEAEIQLNPRELGPIGIKISMNNDQTNVNFVAQNATTREALEAAMPRLREMLSESGLQLGQSDVSQHSFKRDDGGNDGEGRNRDALGDETVDGDELLPGGETMRGVGYAAPSGVDTFV